MKKNIIQFGDLTYNFSDDELILFFAEYFKTFPFENKYNLYIYEALKESYPMKAALIRNNIKAPCFGLDFYRENTNKKIFINQIVDDNFHKLIIYSPEKVTLQLLDSFGVGDFKGLTFHKIIDNKNHCIILLKEASVFISSTGCSVFDRDNIYIDGICNSDGILYANVELPKIFKPLHLEGTSVLLCSAWSNGYFHWILEILPRIILIKNITKDISTISYFIVRQKNSFIIEFLNYFGIDESKLIESHKNPYITFDELLCTDSFENYFRNHEKESIPIEPWISKLIHKYFHQPDKNITPHKKIYIDRQNALVRKIINYKEVKRILNKYDFEIWQLEEMSLEEKITLMQSSKYIIGPGGAGLSNIVFCMPDTNVLIFYNSEHTSDSFYSICRNNNLNHFHLICSPSRLYFDSEFSYSINEDFLINLVELEDAIILMLNG